MQGKLTAAFQQQVKELMVDTPLLQRLGLQRNDLHGAAKAADAALQSGNLEQAFKSYAHLVMLDPTNADFHAGLAEVALDLGHFAMALQSASVVVATRPTAPEGYFLSARACIGMDEPTLALEDLAETERWAVKAGKPAYTAAAQKLRVMVDSTLSKAAAR